MAKKEATTTKEVLKDYSELQESVKSSENKEQLKRLKNTALAGVSYKSWLRKLFFGFSLTYAIEKWLSAFNPSLNKPLGEQIPKEETTEVVAAWMRFSIRRAIILLLMSSFITLVTAIFLYLQIQKQDNLIEVQSEAENHRKKFLYLQLLYDEKCLGTDVVMNYADGSCFPAHNPRQRSEALKGYLMLSDDYPELSRVFLNQSVMSGVDFKKARLIEGRFHNAVIDGSNLRDTDLSKATLINANLGTADLRGANLWKAKLIDADLTLAKLDQANLQDAILYRAKNLTCSMLKTASNWKLSFRDERLSCGEKTPSMPSEIESLINTIDAIKSVQ